MIPIHVAITRRVREGREEEFREALREFFQESFACDGVLGATMIVPPPGSASREFGIIRTFAGEKERDEFYSSPLFKRWEDRCRPLVESDFWTQRPLHGLEAWFRSDRRPPPRWKMALVTLAGVYPVNLLLRIHLFPRLEGTPEAPAVLLSSALIVAALTWIIMPLLTKLLRRFLRA